MGEGNKVEFIVAVCALITSVVAVYIAWDQGRVMRAQQHGEVFPVLQIDGFVFNRDAYSDVGIRVRNSGVGPALIESIHLKVGGEEVRDLQTVLGGPTFSSVSWYTLSGRALAAGDSVEPLRLTLTAEDGFATPDVVDLTRSTENWAVEVCYCSVFNRCWRTQGLSTFETDRVQRCERGEFDVFTEFGEQWRLARREAEPAPAPSAIGGAPG